MQTFEHQTDATLVLRLKNGETIETTKEHPFYVESQDFTAAGEMGIGTAIVTRAGPSATLASSQVRNQAATVYNFEVENTHTYFVGQSDLWVHNACHIVEILEVAADGKKYGIIGSFDDVTGTLDFIIDAGRKAKQSGRAYFDMMVNDPRIGGIQNVKRIESDFLWTNLERINQATAPPPAGQGLPLREALKATTAYRYASPDGFTNWASIKFVGKPGAYTSVKTVLTR